MEVIRGVCRHPELLSLTVLGAGFDPTHPLLPQEHDDHLAADHRNASCWKHRVVVQLHPDAVTSLVSCATTDTTDFGFW